MSEKQVIVILEDGFGRVQTRIATSLSAPQLMDKIMEIDEQQSTIESERDLFEKYKASAIRDMRDYSDKIIEMQKKVDEQQSNINKKKELLKLIANACSFNKEHSVKEILRNEIKGIDTVTYESANAWHDYVLLSEFFEECYGEHWDNE